MDRRRAACVRIWDVAVLLWLVAGPAHAQDAKAVVAAATKAMGVTNLTSVVFRGSAAQGNFGQSRRISFGLAPLPFATTSARLTSRRRPRMPRARRCRLPRAADPSRSRSATPKHHGGHARLGAAVADLVHPVGIPQGGCVGAHGHAEVADGRGRPVPAGGMEPGAEVAFGQPYRVMGYINAQDLVERVETWVEHPLMGDLNVLFTYSDYRDVGGLRVPLRLSQKLAGMETFVVDLARRVRI